MPITLRALAQDRHTLRIDYGDAGDLNLVVTPSLLTEKLIMRLTALTDESDIQEAAGAINTALCRVIAEWDMLDGDGVVIPLTPDALGDVPLAVRVDILSRVADEMRVGESKGTPLKTRSSKRS